MQKNEHYKQIAAKESTVIFWLRGTFFVTLVVIGTVASIAFYRSARNAQLNSFTNEFEGYSLKIIETVSRVLERQIDVADSMSVALTSESRARGVNFPFVALPDFVLRGSAARILGEFPLILWTPLVEEDKREEWETFLRANPSYYPDLPEEEMQQNWQNVRFGFNAGAAFDPKGLPSFQIREYHPAEALPAANNSGPYLPVFDTSPKRPSRAGLNLNILSQPAAGPAFRDALDSGLAVLGKCALLDEVGFCSCASDHSHWYL